jgi:predicted dienelactone hydrolase
MTLQDYFTTLRARTIKPAVNWLANAAVEQRKGDMMHARKFIFVVALCLAPTLAQGAGFRFIDIPADTDGPAIHGAMWYPCSTPPGEVDLGKIALPGVKDCPLPGGKLPLIVVSHGRTGSFVGHHDTDEVLADAGFIVAAINHPGDTATDPSRSGNLSVLVERPTDIRRAIDFMVGTSPVATGIDRERIGFFGFSRGGYTGLVLIGANPDWAHAAAICQGSSVGLCAQAKRREYPTQPLAHDARIKVAVLADPLAIFFTSDSLAAIQVPVQLWASERGGDGVLPHDVASVDKYLRVEHEYHVVPNAGHFAFLTLCPPELATQSPEICTDAPGFDRAAFHRQFDADVLTFFRAHLAKAPP